ncbi:MAG TPA: AbrB/MazE/SpoVT family DNA-binding domain-containing protein [Catalimonadaceae bacterium]|nr:AbrB/MazE/SpoVT family DNA-binding domain-containing protein [Catalimonadaceae bacterium]HPI12512.1 AbrB/MazE/SpoVT family DNA-binding domain-containing protein [Catalimonadaceae bacterium]
MKRLTLRIGKSDTILLPKAILDQYKIGDKMELVMKEDHLILKPKPRNNWEAAFKRMNENGDDQLLMDDVFQDEKL